MQPGTKCGEDHRTRGRPRVLKAPFRGGDQERGGRGVGVAPDVAKETVAGNCERLRHTRDQVEIGLVHQQDLHGGGRDAVSLQQFSNGARDAAGCLQDDGPAMHVYGSVQVET